MYKTVIITIIIIITIILYYMYIKDYYKKKLICKSSKECNSNEICEKDIDFQKRCFNKYNIIQILYNRFITNL
jgi:hypothetical protein